MLESSSRPAGFPLRAIGYAVVAGILAGAAYTASPTTVCFLLLLPILFAWAQSGLGSRERRWVVLLLGVAVAARLLALSAFFLSVDSFSEPYAVLIGDERFILTQSSWMVNLARGQRLDALNYFDNFGPYGRSGLQVLLAYWQLWFGPAPYGAHLLSVAMWLCGAIALQRTARAAFGPLAALGGFAVVLFMPTLFVWSISALKEPAYFFLTATTIAGAATVVRSRRLPTRVSAAVLAACAVAAISTVRSIALAVTAGGLVLAAAGWGATRRVWLGVIAIALVVTAGLWAVRQPAIEARLRYAFKIAAVTHRGHVSTPGYGYWLLDSYFYTREDDINSYMQPSDVGRFVTRAAASFVAVPLPWKSESRAAVMLMPQQVVWYGLAALAGIGMVAGWRRDAVFTWLLVGNVLLGAAAVALYNGNVGTLVRMRDSVVPVIVWLSAVGGCAVLESARRRSSERRWDGVS